MTEVKIPSYWVGKTNSSAVYKVVGKTRPTWLDVVIMPDFDVEIPSGIPTHFLTEDDSLFEEVNSLEEGFNRVNKPPYFEIESHTANWPSKIVDALNSNTVLFKTSSSSVKELILSAANRMGKTVKVDLME